MSCNKRSPCTPVSFRPFCFSAPCQFTPLLNLLFHIFNLRSLAGCNLLRKTLIYDGRIIYNLRLFDLRPRFQESKSRAGLIFFHAVPSSLKCSPSAEFPHRNLSELLPNTCSTTRPLSPILIWSAEWFLAEITKHNSTLCCFLQPSITSSLLGPRMSLSILFPVFIALRSKYLPQYPITFTPTFYYFIVLGPKCLPHQRVLEHLLLVA